MHRPRTRLSPLLLALSLAGLSLLAACHRGDKSDDQRTAAGQVLPGTISDAMLPYDTLKSKPVLAPARAAASAASADSAASLKVAVTKSRNFGSRRS